MFAILSSCLFLFLFFIEINCWISNDFIDIEDVTKHIMNNQTLENAENLLTPKSGITFPGTKWCGPGNTADNYGDLGTEREADMCCREHDYCPDIIPAFATVHNLTNPAPYTRENCGCDKKFYKCLQASNTKTADLIGVIYFNGIMTQCFRYDYPVVRCSKRGGWLNLKCIEYKFNTHGRKRYQWFDEPEYEVPQTRKTELLSKL